MNIALLPVVGELNQAYAMVLSHTVRTLQDSKEFDKVVLYVDSPGGAVSGISELANDVRNLAAVKPVVAFIKNRGASAGYWIASQATEIVAEPSAFVGSLGVAAAMVDTSAAAKLAGIEVTLITSGGVKGMGTPGTPITAEHKAAEQAVVDSIADMFKADVMAGRKYSTEAVAKLFDGKVHIAKDALALGLIDRIGSLESVLHVAAPARSDTSAPAPIVAKTEEIVMTESTTPIVPAVAPIVTPVAVDHMAADIKALAETVKSGGCPLSIDSIVAKLTASVAGEADEIVALEKAMTLGTKLAGMKKFAGSFADKETPIKPVADASGADPKTLRAEWKAKYDANLVKYKGDNMKAFTETNKENAELAETMVKASTLEWDRIAKANGRVA